MAEYIDREDVYNTMKAMYCDECTDEKCQMCEYAKIMFVLDNLPIADVQPVKWISVDEAMPAADVKPIRHGRWTDNVYKYVKSLDAYFIQAKCSVCGRYSDRIDIYSRFMSNECCSRCGARMDGDTE